MERLRECRHECNDGPDDALRDGTKIQGDFFHTPTAGEGTYVGLTYSVPRFQQNIEQRILLTGGRNADAFVIAKAGTEGRAVVPMEKFKPNGTKIPNICAHFGVECLSLEQFM